MIPLTATVMNLGGSYPKGTQPDTGRQQLMMSLLGQIKRQRNKLMGQIDTLKIQIQTKGSKKKKKG